jgi:hypothetical protein
MPRCSRRDPPADPVLTKLLERLRQLGPTPVPDDLEAEPLMVFRITTRRGKEELPHEVEAISL